jgi:predicted O-methyltransferase YrrM
MTPELYNYILDVSLREHPVLQELRAYTAPMKLALMQISPDQAQFLQFLIKITNAKNVLELGTFTGYSALAMALALPDDGKIITCDSNAEWTKDAHKFWQKAQQQHKIELRLAPALETLPTLKPANFDFIFIDADKSNYVNYYEYALKLIKPNGIIAIDNIFWKGKVIDPDTNGAQIREIRKLNQIIKNDNRVDISLLTIGDGLFLIKKR